MTIQLKSFSPKIAASKGCMGNRRKIKWTEVQNSIIKERRKWLQRGKETETGLSPAGKMMECLADQSGAACSVTFLAHRAVNLLSALLQQHNTLGNTAVVCSEAVRKTASKSEYIWKCLNLFKYFKLAYVKWWMHFAFVVIKAKKACSISTSTDRELPPKKDRIINNCTQDNGAFQFACSYDIWKRVRRAGKEDGGRDNNVKHIFLPVPRSSQHFSTQTNQQWKSSPSNTAAVRSINGSEDKSAINPKYENVISSQRYTVSDQSRIVEVTLAVYSSRRSGSAPDSHLQR